MQIRKRRLSRPRGRGVVAVPLLLAGAALVVLQGGCSSAARTEVRSSTFANHPTHSAVHEALVLPGGLFSDLAREEGHVGPHLGPSEPAYARNDATQGAVGPALGRVDIVTFDYIDYQRAGRTTLRDWLLVRTRIRGESAPR